MNIVYLTNTFTPHVGGVARSIEAFSAALRARGHRVLVVAPEFPNMPEEGDDVIRIPAIQNFNASDFSVVLPLPKGLTEKLTDFGTEIIHSHHPFLLGMTAIRQARALDVPLVFTHHTLYEQYTHYVAPENELIATFIVELATSYANLTDQVIAPSESLREVLLERGVVKPITVVPTGVEVGKFCRGDGAGLRRELGIAPQAFVVGHMGRLAPEKNIGFLAEAVSDFMLACPEAVFLLVGSGPSSQKVDEVFATKNLADRLFATGSLVGQELAAALNAMDVFAFSSKSETQGMVLTEAMAAGVPVVALDAPGARDVVSDRRNGRLLQRESAGDFSAALASLRAQTDAERRAMIAAARDTAERFSLANSTDAIIACYQGLLRSSQPRPHHDDSLGLEQVMARLKAEWEIFTSLTHAGDEAIAAGAAALTSADER